LTETKKNKGLTPKQARFCLEYIKDGNGTQAAIRAGYSEKTADQQASRLLTNVKVNMEIDRLTAETRAEVGRTVQSIDRMQQAAYDLAMQLNQPAAAVSAGTAIARLYGMDKSNDLGADKAAKTYSKAEQAKLKAMAEALTGPKLVKDSKTA
jgi:hypothetical protein